MNDIVGPTCIVDQEGLIVPSVHFETRGPSTEPRGAPHGNKALVE